MSFSIRVRLATDRSEFLLSVSCLRPVLVARQNSFWSHLSPLLLLQAENGILNGIFSFSFSHSSDYQYFFEEKGQISVCKRSDDFWCRAMFGSRIKQKNRLFWTGRTITRLFYERPQDKIITPISNKECWLKTKQIQYSGLELKKIWI